MPRDSKKRPDLVYTVDSQGPVVNWPEEWKGDPQDPRRLAAQTVLDFLHVVKHEGRTLGEHLEAHGYDPQTLTLSVNKKKS